MISLVHGVKVFVVRFSGRDLQYLMLKHPPLHEGFWGPVSGKIEPWENPERAVLREVKEETGLLEPANLLEFKEPERLQIGDMQLIEWVYGFQVPGGDPPPPIRLAPELEGYRWQAFEPAYRSLENEPDRRAVIRLQMLLAQS